MKLEAITFIKTKSMRITLSTKKHLPILRLNSDLRSSFPIWDFWKLRQLEKTGLHLRGLGVNAWIYELPRGWYLPPFSLKGKIVLDLGACCGETAYYFLQNGACKVVCVECDPEYIKLLEENKKNLNLNIEIVAERFNLKHLQISHDFIKCDIDSGEVDLLPIAEHLKPCVLEVHTPNLRNQFEKKGFHVIQKFKGDKDACIMVNYEAPLRKEVK
jgi:ribosomal protein L11 methylase PrmA